MLRLLRLFLLAFVVTVISALLNGCFFSPDGHTPAGDDDVGVDAAETDADNGDGGTLTDGGLTDAPTDASIDAPIPANTVEIRLTTPNNVRSGHESEVVLVTGTNVVSAMRTSTPAHPDWDGAGLVTSNPFQVNMALGLNALTATCTTAGGQQLPPVTVQAPAMLLEVGPFTWNAPGADHCTAIAVPQVNGGLTNGGNYAAAGMLQFWSPAGNSEQGFDCPVLDQDGITVLYHYRATINYVAP